MNTPTPPLIPSDSTNKSIVCNTLKVLDNAYLEGNVTIDLSLNDLSDVVISNPISGDVLKYNGVYWQNAIESQSAAGSTRMIQYNDNGVLSANGDLEWNNVAKELKIIGNIDATVITDGVCVLTNGMLTGLNNPVDMTDATNKSYVDNLANGISWKVPVVATSTGVIDINSPGPSIDDVLLSIGNRVLVKNGSVANPGPNSVDNGIYVFDTDLTPLVRATDYNTGSNASGAAVFTEEGTVNSGTGFVCNSVTGSVVGVDPISFVAFNTADVIVAGDALTKTGDMLDVNVDGTTIEVDISNNLSLTETGVTPGIYSNATMNVDANGRITTISSNAPLYYMSLIAVFSNLLSANIRYANWGATAGSESTMANTVKLGKNGTITCLTFTYVSTTAISFTGSANLNYTIGYVADSTNPNNGFIPLASNVVTWNSSNNGTWPSTIANVSIPVLANTQLAVRSDRVGTAGSTTAEVNVLLLIAFN
jgi:hypothetical protein